MNKYVSRKEGLNPLTLWLSYQRYALLALAIAASVLWLTTGLFVPVWWSITLSAAVALALMGLATHIFSQTGKKMAITRRARGRMEEGIFEPKSMTKYCTDPCWRVVVSEVLRESGIPSSERRALIKEFSRIANEESAMLVLVNRHDNIVYTLEGSTVTQAPLTHSA